MAATATIEHRAAAMFHVKHRLEMEQAAPKGGLSVSAIRLQRYCCGAIVP